MTQGLKRAIWGLVIWAVVASGFALSFFLEGGPAEFTADRGRILAGAVFLGLGYVAFAWMLYRTRARGAGGRRMVDERDRAIGMRSSVTALAIVLAFIFIICITLYEFYHDQGQLPVGWMWFLAYASILVGQLTLAASSLIGHLGMGDHGES